MLSTGIHDLQKCSLDEIVHSKEVGNTESFHQFYYSSWAF